MPLVLVAELFSYSSGGMQAKQVATPKHEKPPLNLGFDYFFVLTIAVKNLKRRRTRIDTRVYRWK